MSTSPASSAARRMRVGPSWSRSTTGTPSASSASRIMFPSSAPSVSILEETTTRSGVATARGVAAGTIKAAPRSAAVLRPGVMPIGLPPLERRGEIRASCGCTHGDPFHAGPCLGRGAVADARVQTLPIVEDFDVLEHGRPRRLAGAEADLVDVLRLERGEEALHGRVIEAVAAPAHGLRDAVPLQHRPVGLGGVLHAAVAVVNQPARRPMPLDRHDQGVQYASEPY